MQAQKASSQISQKFLEGFEFFNPCSNYDFFPQRLWRILPSASYLIYKVIFFIRPAYREQFTPYLKVLEVFRKVASREEKKISFSFEEIQIASCFFKQAMNNPSFLEILRACADKKQYKELLKIQSLFNKVDEKKVEEKLDKIELFISHGSEEELIPLSTQELGILQFAKERSLFLKTLQEHGVEGIDSLTSFWSESAKLREHRALQLMKERTTALLKQGPLGFVLSRQKVNEFTHNLNCDALRFLGWGALANYLFTGNPCHVGLILPKEEEQFFSHVTSEGSHEITLKQFDILYPFCFLFRFSIKPLLASSIASQHADLLQEFFSKRLLEEAFIKKEVQLEGALAGIQAGIFGRFTPFWDARTVETVQAREFCTGLTAKTVHRAFLKTLPCLESLGYTKDEIQCPFGKNQHMGRLTVLTFLRHFYEKGMIELVEDPFLTRCIEPGPLKDYMDVCFK